VQTLTVGYRGEIDAHDTPIQDTAIAAESLQNITTNARRGATWQVFCMEIK
jgi:hypothetical protein